MNKILQYFSSLIFSLLLNDIEDHLNTIFVCEMAEKLIYEAAYMTCGAAMVVSVGFETIFFLSYVC
jgi:hypothetical protein